MEIGALSPTKVEQAMLCESRLAGRLNQLEGEDAWDEEFGEMPPPERWPTAPPNCGIAQTPRGSSE